MAQIEDAVFENRVVANERTIKPLVSAGISFLKALESGEGGDNVNSEYSELVEEVENMIFELKRQRMMRERISKDFKYYSAKALVEMEIEKAKDEVEALYKGFRVAEQRRKKLEEYEVMAALINKHSSRNESEAEISRLEAEAEKLRELISRKDRELTIRKGQLRLLVETLYSAEYELGKDVDIPAEASDSGSEEEVVEMEE